MEEFGRPNAPHKRKRYHSGDSESETSSKYTESTIHASENNEIGQNPAPVSTTKEGYETENLIPTMASKCFDILPKVVEQIACVITWGLERCGYFSETKIGKQLYNFTQQIIRYFLPITHV